jgi:hypothetical protein
VASGPQPRTDCMYSVMISKIPNMAMNPRKIVTHPVVNRGLLNIDRSSIGRGVCRSHQTNTLSSTTATRNTPTVRPDSQPRVGASMRL